MHRSRLSFHFNTPHMSRRLLVQIVSVPIRDEVEESGELIEKRVRAGQCHPGGLQRVLDDHIAAHWLKRIT